MSSLRVYCNEMNKLKVRQVMMHRFIELARLESPEQLMVSAEVICLQLRLILEHIAFASLAANRAAYAEARASYAQDYHAKKILGAIAKLNPDFYPRPVTQEQNPDGGTHLANVNGAFLTRSQFETAYDRCGSVLHARNPFREPPDYGRLIDDAERWVKLVSRLLDKHIVHIVGLKGFVLVGMNPHDHSAEAFTLVPADGGDFIDTHAKR